MTPSTVVHQRVYINPKAATPINVNRKVTGNTGMAVPTAAAVHTTTVDLNVPLTPDITPRNIEKSPTQSGVLPSCTVI